MNGHILILVGASCCGKTTIGKELEQSFGYKKVATSTNRLPRKGETDGVDYYFMEKDYFLTHMYEFVETNEFTTGYYYGSSRNKIEEGMKVSSNNTIVICLEMNGARALVKEYGSDHAHIIFINRKFDAILQELDNRIERGEMTREQVAARMDKIIEETLLNFQFDVDLCVDNNGTIDQSVERIKEYIDNNFMVPYKVLLSMKKDGDDKIVLNNSYGDPLLFKFLDIVKYQTSHYLLLKPLDIDPDDFVDGKISNMVFRIDVDHDGEESYALLYDEEESAAVWKLFKERRDNK